MTLRFHFMPDPVLESIQGLVCRELCGVTAHKAGARGRQARSIMGDTILGHRRSEAVATRCLPHRGLIERSRWLSFIITRFSQQQVLVFLTPPPPQVVSGSPLAVVSVGRLPGTSQHVTHQTSSYNFFLLFGVKEHSKNHRSLVRLSG